MITLVKSSFEDWNTTLWSDINVEQMEMDCKKFVKVSNCTIISTVNINGHIPRTEVVYIYNYCGTWALL